MVYLVIWYKIWRLEQFKMCHHESIILRKYWMGNIIKLGFYFNCEHFLFVYNVKQKRTKKFADFIKKIRGFSKFNDNRICWKQIFEILIIHKPSLGFISVQVYRYNQVWTFFVCPVTRFYPSPVVHMYFLKNC